MRTVGQVNRGTHLELKNLFWHVAAQTNFVYLCSLHIGIIQGVFLFLTCSIWCLRVFLLWWAVMIHSFPCYMVSHHMETCGYAQYICPPYCLWSFVSFPVCSCLCIQHKHSSPSMNILVRVFSCFDICSSLNYPGEKLLCQRLCTCSVFTDRPHSFPNLYCAWRF